VWVSEHGRNGVLGAAKWYLKRGVSEEVTPRHEVVDGSTP
jgi:glucokinase